MPVETSPQMTALFVGLFAVAAAAVYLAGLATWTTLRDPTIQPLNRVVRILGAWIVPGAVALAILRSASELAPESLPSSGWMRPVAWLLKVRPRRTNDLADERDDVGGGGTGRHDD
jgi:hypothetical protein